MFGLFRSPVEKLLRYYFSLDREFRFFVADEVRRGRPIWKRAVGLHAKGLQIENEIIGFAELREYLIVYPSGEVVECSRGARNPPAGTFGITPNTEFTNSEFAIDAVRTDASMLSISHVRSESPKPKHYKTVVRNTSRERLRVGSFGGYLRDVEKFMLNTIIGTEFSARQFREWYGQKAAWLEPGEEVFDPSNYGFGAWWIYTVENETGNVFHIGAPVPLRL